MRDFDLSDEELRKLRDDAEAAMLAESAQGTKAREPDARSATVPIVAVNKSISSDQDQPRPRTSRRAKKFLTNSMVVAAWIAICAVGIYYYGPTNPSSESRKVDNGALPSIIDEFTSRKTAESESKNESAIRRFEIQTRTMQDVTTKREATKALEGVDDLVLGLAALKMLKGGEWAEPHVDRFLSAGDQHAKNANKRIETAKILLGEVMIIAAKYP